MALAMEREHTAYCSLLMVAGVVLASPERMLARLVRSCIPLSFTACVLAVACSHRHALLSLIHFPMYRNELQPIHYWPTRGLPVYRPI